MCASNVDSESDAAFVARPCDMYQNFAYWPKYCEDKENFVNIDETFMTIQFSFLKKCLLTNVLMGSVSAYRCILGQICKAMCCIISLRVIPTMYTKRFSNVDK